MNEKTLIEQARDYYLDGVDAETFAENNEMITQWEQELSQNEAMVEWQATEVTKKLTQSVRSSYVTASMALVNGKELDDAGRSELFAKQSACLFVLALTEGDMKGQIAQLKKEIRARLAQSSA